MPTRGTKRMRSQSVADNHRDQLENVKGIILKSGGFSENVVSNQLEEFYDQLGLPNQYFSHTDADTIANHVQSLQAAKILARTSGRPFDLSLRQEGAESAMFVARSTIRMNQEGDAVRVVGARQKELGSPNTAKRARQGVGAAGGTPTQSEVSTNSENSSNGPDSMAGFRHTPVQKMERHIESMYLSGGSSDTTISKQKAGVSLEDQLLAQQMVDTEAEFGGLHSISQGLGKSSTIRNDVWRLQCFRSRGETRPALMGENDDAIGGAMALRLYFLQRPQFPTSHVLTDVPQSLENFESFADPRLLEQCTPDLKSVYYNIVKSASRPAKLGPVIQISRGTNFANAVQNMRMRLESSAQTSTTPASSPTSNQPVVEEDKDLDAATGQTEDESENDHVALFIAHRVGSTHGYFTAIPDVYRYHGLYAVRKYVEPFANGVVVFVFYLRNLSASENQSRLQRQASFGEYAAPSPAVNGNARLPLKTRMQHLVRDASLHFVLPRTSLTPLFTNGVLSAQEVAYAYGAWKFAYHFMERGSAEYALLSDALKDKPQAIQHLAKLQSALQMNAFTEGAILDTFYRNPTLVRYVYRDFARRFIPSSSNHARAASVAAEESFTGKPTEQDVIALRRACADHDANSDADVAVFRACLAFNSAILKTNFYKPDIAALAFRLHPAFLADLYTERPYGLFLVLSSEFRGFHVRFRDVARGGIRVVKSSNAQAFASNLAHLFQEGFGLAATQQRKNKDIPEGGSKGVILLNLGHQDKAATAFKKYADSILDLLLVPALRLARSDTGKFAPVSRGTIVDFYGIPEILFFGPDENTADVMDWASAHAGMRGYPYAKAVTTGKTPSIGGIPHDEYGMTTHSVRAYALGIQRVLGLDPTKCTKFQTGGPDGDLGSNEIKMGNENTVGIVDGSGVLFDPAGINNAELKRLADKRIPVENFDRKKLSKNGFLVTVDQRDVTLPDGTVIESGLSFRNNFHLDPRVESDFFIPCGGRPAAVNINNVQHFLYGLNEDGTPARSSPRFKYIVEGANLFLTQEARLECEKAGVILFKDASANKGGVTSSSLEVMAALCLNDEEFSKHMCVDKQNGKVPDFYKAYVAQVQTHIDQNAELEFGCIQAEVDRAKTNGAPLIPRTILSDELSTKITTLSARVEDSDILWNNETLRHHILRAAIPPTLSKLLGGPDEALTRLPENYKRALFGCRLASRFVYEHGLNPPAGSEFAFFSYVDQILTSQNA